MDTVLTEVLDIQGHIYKLQISDYKKLHSHIGIPAHSGSHRNSHHKAGCSRNLANLEKEFPDIFGNFSAHVLPKLVDIQNPNPGLINFYFNLKISVSNLNLIFPCIAKFSHSEYH